MVTTILPTVTTTAEMTTSGRNLTTSKAATTTLKTTLVEETSTNKASTTAEMATSSAKPTTSDTISTTSLAGSTKGPSTKLTTTQPTTGSSTDVRSSTTRIETEPKASSESTPKIEQSTTTIVATSSRMPEKKRTTTAKIEEKETTAAKKTTKNPVKTTETVMAMTKDPKATDEKGIDSLTSALGIDDLPKSVIAALENGNSDPLLEHLNSQNIYPSNTEIEELKNSPHVPSDIATAVDEWREGQVSPEAQGELEKLAGEAVPKSVIDAMEDTETAGPLTDWLEGNGEGLTPAELGALDGKLQPELLEELSDWSQDNLASDLEDALGIDSMPAGVLEALAAGNSEPLLEHLDSIDAYPSDDALQQLKESPFVSEEVVSSLEEWKDGQLSPESKDALDKLAGAAIPKAVIDAVEDNDTAEPLTEWLDGRGSGFTAAELSSLNETLQPEVFDGLKEWAGDQLAADVQQAFEPMKLPESVLEQMKEGNLDPLLQHLNSKDVYPSEVSVAALKDSPFVPDEIADELGEWKESQITPETKSKLDQVAGKTIPKLVIDDIEKSNSADPLTDWLDQMDIELETSDLAPLNGVLKPELLDQLKDWADEPKLEPVGLSELEKMLGHSIPQPVQDEVQKGNYAPLRRWLDEEEIATSKPEFARLEAGQKQWNVPQSLMDELTDWYESALLRGAVKALDDFAGVDVPKSVLDAIEAGQTSELTAFLDKGGILPSQQAYEKLARQAPNVRLSEELVEALAEWYEAKGVVFTTTEPPSTPTLPPRTLAPGETTTPPFPLSETEALVTNTLQTLGCAALLGIVAGTVVLYAAVVRDPSVERFLHLNQEVALFLGHVLVITMRAKTEHHIPCKLASMGLQFFFLADFAFLLFEALQAFAIATNVVPREGLFTKPQFFVMGWAGAGIWTGVSGMLTHQHYVSAWSCWLNLGHGTAMSTFAPVALMAGAAIILVEAAGMGDFANMPDTNLEQKTASIANQKGLLFTVPLNIGSWFVGLFAVYSANVALYGVVFGLNLALAIAIFAFHTLGNPKVHQMVKSCFGKS